MSAIGSAGYEAALRRMIKTLDNMFRKHGIWDPKVLYLSMGLPGMVDSVHGKTLNLPFLQWDGFDPSRIIADHFNAPSVIENDANVNVIGEYYFGKHWAENMILVTLGTGVGGGILINGEIFGGSRHFGGELGHMVIMADDDLEFCGRKGCLETYCSGSAMASAARNEMNTDPKTCLHHLVQERGEYDNSLVTLGCLSGDAACIRIMEQVSHYLAVGLVNLMELFNPELILIGGGVSDAGELLLKPVREEVKRRVLWEEQRCPILRASLGAEAGMYGACALAAQKAGISPIRGRFLD